VPADWKSSFTDLRQLAKKAVDKLDFEGESGTLQNENACAAELQRVARLIPGIGRFDT
jgi:hypothetical protein